MKVYIVIRRGSQNAGHGSVEPTMELVTEAWPYWGDEPLVFASREACDEFIAARRWRVEALEVEVRE